MFDQQDTSKSTRERVLTTILTRRQCTINELADEVNINPISVRHHISRLEAEGLVTSIEEKHGVGRPRRIYFLTDNGQELFPTRYLRLTLRLLEQLKEIGPQHLINQLFFQMAQDLAADYAPELAGLSVEQKLNLIQRLLTSEGFTVDWQHNDNQYIIRETNCPYFHIGQNHPEVCTVDQTLISTLLKIPAEKVNCMLNGDAHCTFVIPDGILREKELA